jgi:hypothetical protein
MKKLMILALLAGSLLAISPANAVSTCPTGTSFSTVDNTKCVANVPTATGQVTQSLLCNSGDSLINGSCVPLAQVIPSTRSVDYPCNAGDLHANNYYTCAQYHAGTTSSYQSASSPSCPSGGSWNGSNCVDSASLSYTCPSGGTFSAYWGNKCVTGYSGGFPTGTYTPTQAYSCSSGSLSGTSCIYTMTVTRYCPNGGDLSGIDCVITTSGFYSYYQVGAVTTFNCSAGVISQDQLTCTISSIPYAPSISYTGTCPTYYRLDVLTGICNSYLFEPTAILSVDLWKCTTTLYDGRTYDSTYTYDASVVAPYMTKRTCEPVNISTITTDNSEGVYLCAAVSKDTGSSLYYISDNDSTGSTSTASIYCSYQSFYAPDVDISIDSPSDPGEDGCATITTFVDYVACITRV